MDSKPYVKLAVTSEWMLDTAFIGYRVQRGLYTILGKKKQLDLYTYKTYETRLRDSAYDSRKNTYTLI